MIVLVGYLLLFLGVGIAFILVHLLAGKLLRPAKMNLEKATIYECGEPTIGSAWIQFDLRFYVIALLFVVFDVEVAFFFPWAVVFGSANTVANTQLPPQQQATAFTSLIPTGPGYGDAEKRQTIAQQLANSQADPTVDPKGVREAASRFAWIAFLDILVFFGVLLVGFAYLWKRGDLVWVRSTAAETTAETEAGTEVGMGPTGAPLTGPGRGQVPAGAAS